MKTESEKEWWDSLTDEEKFAAYNAMREANKCNSETLDEITNYLLGDDWYAPTSGSSLYDVNPWIVSTIKDYYPNINYSFQRQFDKVMNNIIDYFTHRHK